MIVDGSNELDIVNDYQDLSLLRQKVESMPWWHRIDLGNGMVTPGRDNSPAKLKRMHLSDRLDGKTVLDYGAADGFFSFEAENRGARRVVAADSHHHAWANRSGFDFARKIIGSNVEDQEIDLVDISPETVGTFDIVFFLGVLYHLKDPIMGLKAIASVTREHLILETQVDLLWCRRPAMALYPNSELNCDETNWIGPNPACVKAMLRHVGFSRVIMVWKGSWLRRLTKTARLMFTQRQSPLFSLAQTRAVFHAFK